MVSKFKSQNAAGVFWLIALSIIVHLRFFITPPQLVINTEFYLLHHLLDNWTNLPSVVYVVVYHIIVLLHSVRINYCTSILQLQERSNYLPGMCYVLFTGLLPEWGNISGALLANSIFIALLPFLKNLQEKKNGSKMIFNIGLLISVGVILYPPLLPLAITFLIGVPYLSSFQIRYIIIYLLGLLVPYYFLAGYLYLHSDVHRLVLYLPKFGLVRPHYAYLLPYILTLSIMCLHFLSGLFVGQAYSNRIPFFARKIWVVVYLLFLLSCAVVFLIEGTEERGLLLCTLPLALIASSFYLYVNNKFVTWLFFWGTLLIAVYNNWFTYWHFLKK